MIVIGLFEAKTKLSELCEQVAKRREAIMITRRGKPLVRIEPLTPGRGKASTVWDAREQWERKHGRIIEGLNLPKRAKQKWRNPLAE